MRYLNKIVFINSAHVPYAEIKLDGNVHFIGTQGVGKSTLLSKITDAEPQVADYPFTTKGIQIGHFEKRWRHYQIIDTPGLLDRPVGEMNDIELNAMVALEDLADAILFIFDASETCGYGLPNQFNLLEEIKQI